MALDSVTRVAAPPWAELSGTSLVLVATLEHVEEAAPEMIEHAYVDLEHVDEEQHDELEVDTYSAKR